MFAVVRDSDESAEANGVSTTSRTLTIELNIERAAEFLDYDQIGPASFLGKGAYQINTSKKYVLLFGWLDAQFKQVEKYAQYYRTNGFSAIVLLSSSKDQYIIASGKLDETTEEFRNLIVFLESKDLVEPVSHVSHETNSRNNKRLSRIAVAQMYPQIAVHILSNGGIFRLRRMLHALNARGLQLKRTNGIVLDSCPGTQSAASIAGLVTSRFKDASYVKAAVWPAAYAVAAVATRVADYSNHPVSTSARYAISEGNDGNVRGPRMFVYSRGDDVVQWSDVAEFAESARAEGIVVVEKEISLHVLIVFLKDM
ncbi:hypothetical protein HK100_012811 [Physocladia obscura]|uniref:Uncharacterized protein n=1 Tax=Physocladia obscura TaxID=109957 RepID=A0AAD5T8X1_9FUNG|nr:hypothetical protein HK100_012811 [Physocladia obscura]